MANFEFDLIFMLPTSEHDAFGLADAIYGAGFEDAVVGTGQPSLLAVSLVMEGEEAEAVIVGAVLAILKKLPAGSALREVRPDLVSLADVAKKLDVSRQTLQKRDMPMPAANGLYRVTEVAEAIATIAATGPRRTRMNFQKAQAWLNAGQGAQCINARLALGESWDALSDEARPSSRVPAGIELTERPAITAAVREALQKDLGPTDLQGIFDEHFSHLSGENRSVVEAAVTSNLENIAISHAAIYKVDDELIERWIAKHRRSQACPKRK